MEVLEPVLAKCRCEETRKALAVILENLHSGSTRWVCVTDMTTISKVLAVRIFALPVALDHGSTTRALTLLEEMLGAAYIGISGGIIVRSSCVNG